MRGMLGIVGSVLLLMACSGGDGDGGGLGSAAAPASCLSADCGSKQRLVDIPGAENLFFTDAGRLFVTGNDNIYELLSTSGGYVAQPRSAGTAGGSGFGGIAQRGNVLYVNVFDDGGLWAAELNDAPEFSLIHAMGLASPNGLSDGPDGELYVVNGPLIAAAGLPDPKVVRLRFAPEDAMQVVEQVDWLALPGLQPNGIARRGRSLFISASRLLPPSLGLLLRVEIAADGQASEPEVLLEFNSIPDDLSVAGDALLLSFFSEGAIALLSDRGELLSRSAAQSFDSPSQLRMGRPPLFDPQDVLVTEKGLLLANPSSYGNALSIFRRHRGGG